MATRIDEVEILTALYTLEGSLEDWLGGVAERVMQHLGADLGAAAILWHPRWDGTYAREGVTIDTPAGLEDTVDAVNAPMMRPELLAFAASIPFGGLCESFAPDDPFRVNFFRHLAPLGVGDAVKFSALDTPAHACTISPFFTKPVQPSGATRARYARLSAHLSSAMRLRRRWGGRSDIEADAVFDPGGRDHDARGEATEVDALDALRRAVIARERAHTRAERSDLDGAIGLWEGLVSGRWSLLDRFESDGRRFVVAHRNDNVPRDPRALTPREEHVAQLVATGAGNDDVAYALGISSDTVATHLASALRKLRCRGRGDLVRMARSGHFEFTWTEQDDVVGVLVEEPPSASPHTKLTRAETEVLELLLGGLSNEAIARARKTSVRTVANQVAAILEKTGAPSRYALMTQVA